MRARRNSGHMLIALEDYIFKCYITEMCDLHIINLIVSSMDRCIGF